MNDQPDPIEDRLRATLQSVAATTVVPPTGAGDATDAASSTLGAVPVTSIAPLIPLTSPRAPQLAWRLIGAAAVVLLLIGTVAMFSRGSDVTLQPAEPVPGYTTGTRSPGTAVPAPTNGEAVDADGVPIRPSATMKDHWHAAYGIYLCDQFVEPLNDTRDDADGIHTHGEGIIHIHPFTAAASGANATLGLFADQVGMMLGDEEIVPPDVGTGTRPAVRCSDAVGRMVVYRWSVDEPNRPPEIVTSDLRDIRFDRDRMAYTIAFVAPGVIPPKPPSIPTLDDLSDIAPTAAVTVPDPACANEACPPTNPTVMTIPIDPTQGPTTTAPATVEPPTLPQTYCVGYTRWREWMMAAPGAQSTLRPEFLTYMNVLIELAPDVNTLKADLALVRDLWSDPDAQPNDGSTEIVSRVDQTSNEYCALRPE